MKKFDYDFLLSKMCDNDLLNRITSIYTLSTAEDLRKVDLASNYEVCRKDARLKSIAGSNAIEGIVISEDRLVEIVEKNASPLDEREAQIAGYRDAFDYICANYKTLTLSEELILQLHRMIFAYAPNYETGIYKSEDNVILEYDHKGNGLVRFKPLSAEETPQAMKDLLKAYNDAKANKNINPLIIIPCFILDLSCIHPFLDGTGRISRLLTNLLLFKEGFDIGLYVSLEDQINIRRYEYLESLKLSSQNWIINENDYSYVINDFIYALNTVYKQLNTAFSLLDGHKLSKAQRVENFVLSSKIPISKRSISEALIDISPTTVELVLGNLMKDKKIVRIGQGRSSKYIRK